MRFASPGAMIVAFRRFLFLLVVLDVKIWLVKALFLTTLPVPVLRNRLAAPLFVFIFGIFCSVFYSFLLRFIRRRCCRFSYYLPFLVLVLFGARIMTRVRPSCLASCSITAYSSVASATRFNTLIPNSR